MIAALPMYDWTEEEPAIDALWQLIRNALDNVGLASPERLARGQSLWDIWEAPDLILGQTCGLPYRSRLHGNARLVGTFDYGLPGAPPGHYYSHIVARADDPRRSIADFDGVILALNGFDSQSGWVAAADVADIAGLHFRDFHHTGAHRDSALAVADGRAGLAAIDAVTWRLVERHMPGTSADLRIVTSSTPTPAPPLICGADLPVELIAEAVATATAQLPESLAARLGITGFVRIPAEDYLAVHTPSAPTQTEPVL
ncbi:phosphate/phosphite/phosphonate ABC transporter substrate-binding protein [Pseudoruegeria sp. HB172150]|uniref:phosphate/phosphite/phosphonate ABC transporter substrate-binding protein n=1 Tax=Pseudoruegeria sp. HB172150 TaxID=2721164 RepID=UPI001553645F|nr:PhnD/SsuA/transferrin family substrate-binding protein [Pseudoruegeria sp. HB172150]